ncbi:MAG: TonB-dependent receptor, partial [Pseudohongiellaceae bacterium]
MYRHSAVIFIFTFITPFSLAQDIEEIVVTADYRQSSINAVNASVTVLDETLIQQKNAQHLEDILNNAPNLNFSSGASRARFYQIRGIGERGQFTEPLNPSVGVIIDGVDFSGIGNAAMLYDVEQVEILLGPQGTRYGSNALAGLINLRSKQPTDAFAFGAQMEAANYDSKGLAAYVSGPVSKQLGYRLSMQNIASDGFSNNLFLDRPTNKRDETTLRGKLVWQATPDIRLDLNASLMDLDNGYDAFSLDNIRDTLADEPGFDRQRSNLISGNLSVDSSPYFSLEANIGYGDADIEYGYDEDWVHEGFHPFEYSSTDYYFRDRSTSSGELKLLSKDRSALFGGTTDWVVGLYSLQQGVDLRRVYTYLPGDFSSNYEIDRLATYAETSTALGDSLSLTVGLRLERFQGDYHDSDALAFGPDDNLYGGKLALNWYTAADNLVYLSASRGYKTGGFNTDGSLDAELREFDSEQLWNYELGFKGFLFDGSLQTRVAVFYM